MSATTETPAATRTLSKLEAWDFSLAVGIVDSARAYLHLLLQEGGPELVEITLGEEDVDDATTDRALTRHTTGLDALGRRLEVAIQIAEEMQREDRERRTRGVPVEFDTSEAAQ